MKKRTPRAWKTLFDLEEFERRYYYEGTDLGVTLQDSDTVFKVWAPTADSVTLHLYKNGTPGVDDGIGTVPMKKEKRGVWAAHAGRNLKNCYYTYAVTADGQTRETQDVYAKACGVNGLRSMIADLSDTDPAGWERDCFRYDAKRLPVIYEVHIRDFSEAESSGIPAEYRGTYKAFTVTDSTLGGKGEKTTCLAYLKELGITHVHLLPCFDFASIDERAARRGNPDGAPASRNGCAAGGGQYNWGYDPANYNVPEGSYATDPYDGLIRIREFKEMVQALHAAGIGVVMDVVYNHTFSMDSCFQRTVPYYYYRQKRGGACSNGSGCGNETASERAMFRKYMTESVCYWAKEYHIDGFRFDLMGLHDVETMNGIRRALDALPGGRSILMYGEPWTAGESAMREGCVPAIKANVEKLDARIAMFNDDTRDAVKGSVFSAAAPGFVNGGEGLGEKIRAAVCAWCGEKAPGGYRPHDPGQTISYVSAHDNWTLWDKLCYTMQKTPEFRRRDEAVLAANRFAAGIVLTSLGTVFFQAGEEAARTKEGIGDSYQSPPGINALDWERMYRYEELMEYYKGMLAIRRSFSGYWQRSRDVVRAIRFYEAGEDCVVFSFDAQCDADPWKRLWVVYLAGREDIWLRLPAVGLVRLSDGVRVSREPSEPLLRCEEPAASDGVRVSREPLGPVLRCAEPAATDDAQVSREPAEPGYGETVPVRAGAVSVFGEIRSPVYGAIPIKEGNGVHCRKIS